MASQRLGRASPTLTAALSLQGVTLRTSIRNRFTSLHFAIARTHAHRELHGCFAPCSTLCAWRGSSSVPLHCAIVQRVQSPATSCRPPSHTSLCSLRCFIPPPFRSFAAVRVVSARPSKFCIFIHSYFASLCTKAFDFPSHMHLLSTMHTQFIHLLCTIR